MASEARYRVFYEHGHFWSVWFTQDEFLSILKNVGMDFTAVEVSQTMTRKEIEEAGIIPANSLMVK